MAHTLDLVNYLVDLLTVKEFLGIESSQTDADSSVIIQINAVSNWMNNKTNRLLRQRSITEYRDGNGLSQMYTREWPVESLLVYIDTTMTFGAASRILSGDMLISDERGRVTLKNDIFDEGIKSVKFVYDGGYSTIPYDLQMACLTMIHKIRNPQASSVSSVSIAGGNTVFFDAVAPKFVLDVIELYKPMVL